MERMVFIAGRQHCGNTMLANALGLSPKVYAAWEESMLFDHLKRVTAMDVGARLGFFRRDLEISPNYDEAIVSGVLREVRSEVEAREGDPPSVTELYRLTVTRLLASIGRPVFVQKATSYVFYADEIFRVFPEAKILFLIRSPLDIAASKKKRRDATAIFQMVWGWNAGLKAAIRAEERHPGRFLIIRYEDLVTEPEPVLRRVSAFIGIPYTEDFLGTEMINPADQPYRKVENAPRGIVPSRVNRFRTELSPPEVGFVRRLADAELFRRFYPDQWEETAKHRLGLPGYLGQMARGWVFLLRTQLRRFVRNPLVMVDRVRKRLIH